MTQDKVILLLENIEDFSSPVFGNQIKAMEEAALSLPHDVELVRVSRDNIEQKTPVPIPALSRPTIVYGSIPFVRDIKSPIFPGAYGFHGTDWVTITAHIPRSLLFNHNYHITTWSDFCTNYELWCERIGTNSLFIRPCSDKKIFAGQVIKAGDFTVELPAIDQTTSVQKETLIVVAPSRSMFIECRFFIVNREVVSWSQYLSFLDMNDSSQHEHVTVENRYFDSAKDLAKIVAQLDWQPDSCYTCDIAVDIAGKASIVEMNSFSSSGVYNADAKEILMAVVLQARRDFYP